MRISQQTPTYNFIFKNKIILQTAKNIAKNLEDKNIIHTFAHRYIIFIKYDI